MMTINDVLQNGIYNILFKINILNDIDALEQDPEQYNDILFNVICYLNRCVYNHTLDLGSVVKMMCKSILNNIRNCKKSLLIVVANMVAKSLIEEDVAINIIHGLYYCGVNITDEKMVNFMTAVKENNCLNNTRFQKYILNEEFKKHLYNL